MLCLALLCAACGPSPLGAPAPPRTDVPSPARPAQCDTVRAGRALQPLIDTAAPGTILCLEPGSYQGPLELRRAVTVWGNEAAVIKSSGHSSTVLIKANEAALVGVVVDGSGSRYDLLDAAVRIEADDVRVESVTIKNAVFGLLVEKSNRVVLRNNTVHGPDKGPLGLRGDGVRMWETRESLVEGNRILGARDMVVWYSPGNRFINNRVERGRYGTHFMYSHDNLVEGNAYIDNVVGIFIMYSRNVRLRDNLLVRARGAGGMGLGLKESGNLTVTNNRFLLNTVGIYVDNSPLYPDDHNRFEANQIRLSQTGIIFHSSQRRNTFAGNAFRDNQTQVEVAGGGDALGVTWRGNDFDDYAGYDMDGDGYGDVPYQLKSLSSTLRSRYPNLSFFHGSLTLSLIDALSHLFPLFQPKEILVDPRPRVGAAAGGTA